MMMLGGGSPVVGKEGRISQFESRVRNRTYCAGPADILASDSERDEKESEVVEETSDCWGRSRDLLI